MALPRRLLALWSSRKVRASIAAFGVAFTMLLGLVWPGDTSHAAAYNVEAIACSKLPAGMPHHSVKTDPGGPGAACDQTTKPVVKRCTTGVLGSMLVGLIFGGPVGILSGAAGGVVGCAAGMF